MGTKTKSWWLDHGIGCRVNNESWIQDFSEETGRLIPPEEFVEGCILEYYYVEVIHAGVQCLLAVSFLCALVMVFRALQLGSVFYKIGKKFFLTNFSKFLPDWLNFYQTWSAGQTYFAASGILVSVQFQVQNAKKIVYEKKRRHFQFSDKFS